MNEGIVQRMRIQASCDCQTSNDGSIDMKVNG